VCFPIERRFDPHEMRHVGNVNAQSPVTIFQSLDGNGIVEIAGIDRIDRDCDLLGQIGSPRTDALVECLGLQSRLFDRVVGEFGHVHAALHRQLLDVIGVAQQQPRRRAKVN
jgi:hypothetical protein